MLGAGISIRLQKWAVVPLLWGSSKFTWTFHLPPLLRASTSSLRSKFQGLPAISQLALSTLGKLVLHVFPFPSTGYAICGAMKSTDRGPQCLIRYSCLPVLVPSNSIREPHTQPNEHNSFIQDVCKAWFQACVPKGFYFLRHVIVRDHV